MTRIRLASLDDVKGIVDVYCSNIDRWIKRVDDREIEVNYNDLSVEERFSHGGPWMSVETYAIHLNYLLVNGQYPLVAELDGKIVGELELYIGEEKGVLGKTAFIDVLEVHRSYRRRGIGRALVGKAIEIARENGCDTVSVWPDKNAIGFYEKCGLTWRAYNIVHVEVDLSKIRYDDLFYHIEVFPEEYKMIRDMMFISPRIESSFTAWIKSRWDYAVEENRITSIEGYLPGLDAAFVIESMWDDRKKARLLLWVRSIALINDVFKVLFNIARKQGFNKMILLVDNQLYREFLRDYPHKIVDEEVVLALKIH